MRHHLCTQLQRRFNVVYIIVGDGPEEGGLKRLAYDFKVGDRVQFVGRKSQADLARYYQAADLYVQASRNDRLESREVDVETMGRTYFEAGGCGIPVIGARVGGVPSVIEDGKNGLLVDDPENVEEVSGVVSQLLSDPALRAKFGAAGVKLAAEKFSWKRVGNDFKKILMECAEKKE